MDTDTQRRILYGLLSMALGLLAAKLAQYITNRLLGEPAEEGFRY